MSKRKANCNDCQNKKSKNDDLFDDDSDVEQEMCDIVDDFEMWIEDEEFEQLMCKAVDDYESIQNMEGNKMFKV